MEGKGKGRDEATTTTTNANIILAHNPDHAEEDVFMDQKEISIQWADEDGRILSRISASDMMCEFPERLTPMLGGRKLTMFEACRLVSRKLQAKIAQRIREAQSKTLKTPDLVLTGHVTPCQASDPRSGFPTMEDDVPTPMLGDGMLTAKEIRWLSHEILRDISSAASDTPSSSSLEDFPAPMLGDTKVERLLGTKRKSEHVSPKKPKMILEAHNPDVEDVFMDQELKDIIVQDEKIDETIHANTTLGDSKLVDDQKEMRIEWADEHGRILSAFDMMGDFPERLTPIMLGDRKLTRFKAHRLVSRKVQAMIVERTREAQSKSLKTPDLALTGHVTPCQASDPRSGFATMEDVPTPMLGDTKVEHLLGIKRIPEAGDMGSPKKPPKT